MASDPGPSVETNDPRLHRYLTAPDEGAADVELGRLLSEEAAPLLDRVLRGQLGGAEGMESELEDLRASALLRLARQFQAVRRGEADPIAGLPGYVAVTGFNAWRAWLRARHPERARLLDRLRYTLTHDRGLALWQERGGGWLCGPERLRPRGPMAWPAAGPEEIARALAAVPRDWGELPFGAQVHSVVEFLRRPCRFADLVAALAHRLALADPTPIESRDGEGGPTEAVDPGESAVERLIGREYLARLWKEIRELPRSQRCALLLNLRDERGQEMLGLFPLTGVAELPEIAATLELAEAELAGIWPELPRDDLWIADWLGVTRRQVINLRKSARARLARRMGGRMGGR